jgi:transposase-like protein
MASHRRFPARNRSPLRSAVREIVRRRTAELEAPAVEMDTRGLSTRDIQALFAGFWSGCLVRSGGAPR